MELNKKIFVLAENFAASAKILTALGDETRQHLILEMMKMGNFKSTAGRKRRIKKNRR